MNNSTIADLDRKSRAFSREMVTDCVHECLLVTEAVEAGPDCCVQPLIVDRFPFEKRFQFQLCGVATLEQTLSRVVLDCTC